jgi:hypothetical protein
MKQVTGKPTLKPREPRDTLLKQKSSRDYEPKAKAFGDTFSSGPFFPQAGDRRNQRDGDDPHPPDTNSALDQLGVSYFVESLCGHECHITRPSPVQF